MHLGPLGGGRSSSRRGSPGALSCMRQLHFELRWQLAHIDMHGYCREARGSHVYMRTRNKAEGGGEREAA
jgi:hypothetical protein